MKLKLVISYILALSLCLQQPLRKTDGLQCQNRVIVSKSCALRKATRLRDYVPIVLRLTFENQISL